MLSNNYYKSYDCLNEMGAVWALRAEYQAILLPGFYFPDTCGAIVPQRISFKLDDVQERSGKTPETA